MLGHTEKTFTTLHHYPALKWCRVSCWQHVVVLMAVQFKCFVDRIAFNIVPYGNFVGYIYRLRYVYFRTCNFLCPLTCAIPSWLTEYFVNLFTISYYFLFGEEGKEVVEALGYASWFSYRSWLVILTLFSIGTNL